VTVRAWLLPLALVGACGGSSNTGQPDASGVAGSTGGAGGAGGAGGSSGGGAAGSTGGAAPPAFLTCGGRAVSAPPTQSWRHTTTSVTVVVAGAANHSAQDVIALPGAATMLPGKFAYGVVSKDLEDESVRVLIDDCGTDWRDLGTALTDGDGRVAVNAPTTLGAGLYEVRFQVLGDATGTTSYLWILPAGTHVVVSDIDGTLTQSDSQLFMQILDGSHVPVPYLGAVDLTKAHAATRAIVVYLTGRPYWLTQRTRDWLVGLGFQPGPLHVTDSNEEAVPSQSGVGAFKLAWLQGLKAKGYQIDFAYGNAATDIYAYLGAGCAADAVWIIGDNAGQMGTNAAQGSWTARVAEVRALPPVTQPF
jgi:hypothetical protein